MAYKILYIEDLSPESREDDLRNLGFDVETFKPSSDMNEISQKITEEINALILDYRLTEGDRNACFDAPTIAQTIRSKHSNRYLGIPIVLMSNEDIITDYYKDFSSQDLFDFTLTKKDFNSHKVEFKNKLESFLSTYSSVIASDFKNTSFEDVPLKLRKLLISRSNTIHSGIITKLSVLKDDPFAFISFINNNIIHSIGALIGPDVLSARLGVSKDSPDWGKLLESIEDHRYIGVFSDIEQRWWMDEINFWWKEVVKSDIPLRRLGAEERIQVIKENLKIENLNTIEKTTHSQSSNFWTICKHSKVALDPFDGIELFDKDYLPWQEKEYLSFDSALDKMDDYKDFISAIDKKAVRELAKKINQNG